MEVLMAGYHSLTQNRKGVPNNANAATRKRIEESGDPVGFLISIMNGEPVSKKDADGNVVGYDKPNIDHRINAARELLKKLVPDLKAVEVGTANGEAITFQFQSAVAIPNSAARQAAPIVEQIAQTVVEEMVNDD
jgi:hypothetical protein